MRENKGQKEVLKSTARRENSDQHYSEESSCFYPSVQKNKTEFFNPILLPDLQVRITNIVMPEFSATIESLAMKDNFGNYVTEARNTEINEEGKVPGFEIYSQCSGENSDYPCEDEFGNIRQELRLVNKSEISLPFDLSHNTYMNHTSEELNSGTLLTESSNATTISNQSGCPLTKSKTDYNDARSKKGTESRISKRKGNENWA